MLQYEMMPEHMPVLRDIFRTHGDIAKDCSATEKVDRKRWLEMVCDVVLNISKTDQKALEISHLKSKLATVRGIQHMKVEVEWLIIDLDELISEKQELDKLEEEREESRKQVQILQNEYDVWQERVDATKSGRSLAKDKLQEKENENSKLTEDVSTAESKLKKTWHNFVRLFKSKIH